MMKKKKIIITVGSVLGALLIALILFFLLNGDREWIAKAENSYEKTYRYTSCEMDPNISIDGILDEDVWKDKEWFSNTYITNVGGNVASFKITGFPTKYGVYVASVAYDTNLVNDGQRNPNTNSAWNMYFTANNVGEEKDSSAAARQLLRVDMVGDACCEYQNFERAVVVEGELNSADTKSATLEAFVPWEVLQIDTEKGIPEEFGMHPAYRAVLAGQSNTTYMSPVYSDASATKDYYRFDKNGYMSADRDGAVVGDSKFGYAKSGNWDISKEAEGIVQSSFGENYHKIFFKEQYGNNFIVEAKLTPVKALNEPYPKAGIYFQGVNGKYHTVFLDMFRITESANGRKNFTKRQLVTLNNGEKDWDMRTLTGYDTTNPDAAKKEGTTLTVVKYGEDFWYFVDGMFCFSEKQSFMDMETFPGFFTLGADVIFSDYSCKEIKKEELGKYLLGKGMYLIDAKAATAGGTVEASETSVQKGGSYNITITSKSGYEVSSILVNGKERLADAKKNASGGVYTISNVTSMQEVRVSFEKCKKAVEWKGVVQDSSGPISANITLTGKTHKVLRYQVEASGKKGYSVEVPAGSYEIRVEAEGYKTQIKTVQIKAATTLNFTMELSNFPVSVTVNGKEVKSNRGVWDLSEEGNGKVSGSFEAGTKEKPLYFGTTGKNFVLETTIDYTTDFVSGVKYQYDLFGGFFFNDGSHTAWVAARETGFVHNWKYEMGLLDYKILTYPEKNRAEYAVAKQGDRFYVYFDGKCVAEKSWSEVAPGISADKELALGLCMIADKPADIQFSNYKVTVDGGKVKQYIANHAQRDSVINENPMFSSILTINGTQIKSLLRRWDLSRISGNVVSGSYELGTRECPLYFTQTGNTALMEAYIEYPTQFVNGVDYQPDLFGGFCFTNGKNRGWITANSTGIVYNWKWEHGLISNNVLKYPDARPVKLTIALKDNYFYVFMDDVYVTRKKVSLIIPNAKYDENLAFGLYMITDKPADIRYSNLRMTTDAAAVDAYINTYKNNAGSNNAANKVIGSNPEFSEVLTVNNKTLTSSLAKWDLSQIANNVISGSFAKGTKEAPLYFTKTGDTLMAEANIEYTTEIKDGVEYQPDLFGGFSFSNGKRKGWITANGTGIVYNWKYKHNLLKEPVLMIPDKKSVKLTVVLKDNVFHIYMDDKKVTELKLAQVIPYASANEKVAVSLYMIADKTADIRFSNVRLCTDVAEVDAYMNRHK